MLPPPPPVRIEPRPLINLWFQIQTLPFLRLVSILSSLWTTLLVDIFESGVVFIECAKTAGES